jgi:hypothetical protein
MQDLHSHRTFELAAGQSLQFRTRAGTQLVMSNGSLLLTQPPIWLGDQMFRARVPLEAGQVESLDEGGWITLTGGQRGGQVQIVSQRRFGWLGLVLQNLRRLLGGQPVRIA